MFRTETLDTLFAARDDLSDRIIDLVPSTPAEKAELQQLMQRRDRVSGAINGVIAAQFRETASGLDAKVAALQARTAELEALARTLATIAAAVAIVDGIVQLTAGIVEIAAV